MERKKLLHPRFFLRGVVPVSTSRAAVISRERCEGTDAISDSRQWALSLHQQRIARLSALHQETGLDPSRPGHRECASIGMRSASLGELAFSFQLGNETEPRA
jgi:hypothetical protein